MLVEELAKNNRLGNGEVSTQEQVVCSRLDRVSDWEAVARRAKFEVATLAVLCNVSERQLRRYFRSRFKISPGVWAAELRLQDSVALLVSREPLKAIAVNLGFSHVSHFCRAFKRRFGVTPTQYLLTKSARTPVSKRASTSDSVNKRPILVTLRLLCVAASVVPSSLILEI